MVERCALSGSDLKIKFRIILLTSMGLKSAHFQEYDFQESGEVNIFFENGHPFSREIELS